jgi:RecB family endonuclease NucS
MKIIRYAINKDELHSLLRSIGVLREQERLLAVNNLDLSDPSHDIVVVTATTHPSPAAHSDPSSWSADQVRQRLAELAILEDSATRQLQVILEELHRLQEEGITDSAGISADYDDDIPSSVEKNIRDQIRRVLSAGGKQI